MSIKDIKQYILVNEFEIKVSISVVLILYISFYVMNISNKREKAWLKDNECKVVQINEGKMSLGITSNGHSVIIPASNTKSYLCKDGIIYVK